MKTKDTYIITLTVKTPKGLKPDLRTIGGDTVFLALVEGQSARYTMKKIKKPKPRKPIMSY